MDNQRRLIGDFKPGRLIRGLLLIYATVVCLAFLFSDRVIFPAPSSSYKDGPNIIKLETADGTQISAVYLSNPKARYTILYSHGNSEDIGDVQPLMNTFVVHGFSVFAYDYRGYGTSGGRPSEEGVYRDVEAAYEHMVQVLGISGMKIIALGRSLGNGPATYLASQQKIAGLIMESPFITAYRVVTRYPLIPFDKFRNVDKIHKVTCPVLVIHGTADRVIPFWHGQTLFKKANEPKLSLWIDGAGHFDLMNRGNRHYWDTISKFVTILDKHIEPQ